MSQSITDLYGPSATKNGSVITFNANDFASSGLDSSTPTASQIMAAHLNWFITTKTAAITDKTAGISPAQFQQAKFSAERDSEQQIGYPFTLVAYRLDTGATFDPDAII